MMIDRFSYRSQTDDAPDGFAGYSQLYSCGTDADRGAGRFEAGVTAFGFRRLLMSDRQLSGVRHTRSAQRVRRDGFDHVAMQLVLHGGMIGGALDEQRSVQPGEIIIFDMTRPQRTVVQDARVITLSLPREELERHLALPHALHGTILPARVGGLLGEFMQALVREATTLAPYAANQAGSVVAMLAASALNGYADPGRTLPSEVVVQFRFERIKRHIAACLPDPTLDAAGTAAALGLSRSTLDRALAPSGGFGALLLSMRLDRMRAALSQTGESVTVGTIAHGLGFSSLSYCSRTFSTRFGLPPQRWRAQQAEPTLPARGTAGTLDYLLQQIR